MNGAAPELLTALQRIYGGAMPEQAEPTGYLCTGAREEELTEAGWEQALRDNILLHPLELIRFDDPAILYVNVPPDACYPFTLEVNMRYQTAPSWTGPSHSI